MVGHRCKNNTTSKTQQTRLGCLEERSENVLHNRHLCTPRPKHPEKREAKTRPLSSLECRSEKDLPTVHIHSRTDSVGSYWSGDELPREKPWHPGIWREGNTNNRTEDADKGPRWIDEGD